LPPDQTALFRTDYVATAKPEQAAPVERRSWWRRLAG
jgi:hypothetical protein